MNTVGGFPVEVLEKGKDLRDIIRSKIASPSHEDPFYVVDVGRIVHLYEKWTSLCPNVKPFYAVKCNNNPVLLKILSEIGVGFDCANKAEIETILNLGVQPDRIIFANPCKHISHLQYAAEKNVAVMTFDNDPELTKTATHYPSAKLVVRIRADDPTADNLLGVKFGCSVAKACGLLRTAKKMNLDVIGVSFHVGTPCQSPNAFKIALEKAYQVFQFANSIGYQFSLLDVGGGFPGPRQEQDSLLAAITTTINATIKRLFTAKNPSLNIISEPGRYFACIPFTIAVAVTSKRVCERFALVKRESILTKLGEIRADNEIVSDDDDEKEKRETFMYYVSDGIFGSFMFTLFFQTKIITKPLRDISGPQYTSSVWGSTLANVDKICHTRLPELNIGDWLYMEEMGAYTSVLHTKFSGFNGYRIYYFVREEDRAICQKNGLMLSKTTAVDQLEE